MWLELAWELMLSVFVSCVILFICSEDYIPMDVSREALQGD